VYEACWDWSPLLLWARRPRWCTCSACPYNASVCWHFHKRSPYCGVLGFPTQSECRWPYSCDDKGVRRCLYSSCFWVCTPCLVFMCSDNTLLYLQGPCNSFSDSPVWIRST
jgi:hypothetical protein